MSPYALSITLCLALTGCASWLPQSQADTTPFENYEAARKSVLALEPMTSDRTTLAHNGFNQTTHPNILLLTHADVARRFLPSAMLRREDLDPGIVLCLESRDACTGLEVQGARISKVRTGGFWADFLNFQRRTETKGWRFSAVVLLVSDLVVYRSISGQPDINEVEVTRNPLGPLQDIGPAQAKSAVIP